MDDDDDDAQMWVRLQNALAMKRELQRKVTAAHTTTQMWQTHRESVKQLAGVHNANGATEAHLT